MVSNQYVAYGNYGSAQFTRHDAGAIGDAEDLKATLISPGPFKRQRVKMNMVAVTVSLFVPWILFSLLFADVSFRIHFKLPGLCWGIVVVAALFVLTLGARACMNINQLLKNSPEYQPTWYVFLFITSCAAVVLGPVLGNANFWQNMQPYYDLRNLNEYYDVDPARMRGEQMMDAGQAFFVEGAVLDLKRAYAFQNVDTYCVAPITVYNKGLGAPTPLSSYDFWAVGLNCCGGNSTEAFTFQCGPYRSHTARQGLRLMIDQQRPFFRLAVQQAESAHMISSVHPLFFHWTENADADLSSFLADAFRSYAIYMCGFFGVQLALVLTVSFILSKTGHGNL